MLSAVQVLRGRAQAAGKLQSGPQQTVNVTPAVSVAPSPGTAVAPPPQVITIAPTHPDQVFVPAYDPSVVYGAWPYPSYPPAYYPPPVGWGVGNAILTGMAFAGGVAVVNSLWGWARPWLGPRRREHQRQPLQQHQREPQSDQQQPLAARREPPPRRSLSQPGGPQHVPRRRRWCRGEPCPGARAVPRPGAAGRAGRGDRRAASRWRPADFPDRRPGAGGNRPGLGDRRPGGDGGRAGLADRRAEGSRDRPNLAERRGRGGPGAQRPAVQHRPSGRPQTHQEAAHHAPQGLQGVGNGRQERAAAERGRASRQGQPAARAQAHQRAAAHAGGGRGGWAAAHRGGGRHR